MTNKIVKPPSISPLKLKREDLIKLPKSFSTMDIETISLKEFDNIQIPIIISSTFSNNNSYLIQIDSKKLKLFVEERNIDEINNLVLEMWKNYLSLITSRNIETIFVHNLGKFDGYFLYNGLLKTVDNIKNVNTIIDNKNNFISVYYSYKKEGKLLTISWKDSLRLFPISLDQLCKTFQVIGKTSEYNLDFNDISLFDNLDLFNQFLEYSKQDSLALYKALSKAQQIYKEKYFVDICDVLSASSLSLKIFRLNYLDIDIPILKNNVDSFIRKSYFGGATDYYKAYGEDLHYYDVNSLYPEAMIKPMPLNLIKTHKNMSSLSLKFFNNFFGFVKCRVTTPKHILKPILPFKHEGKTIFPTGTWIATYFSEEIKEALKLGYKFEFFEGYEFDTYPIFNSYVHDFFLEKKEATGAKKFIAKLHLNSLYGIMGRRQELIRTVNVRKEELYKYVISSIIHSIISITDDTYVLLISDNLNTGIVNQLNIKLNSDFKSFQSPVLSNVAIASAVTAYARIHMIPFKLDTDCYYTDTDSIFTKTKLNTSQIGDDLGLMKDELGGKLVKEAYFLGIKQYGYSYIDPLGGETVNKSVFAGVARNSLTLNQIKELHLGGKISKTISSKFFKSFTNLSIKIKDINLTISANREKELKDNVYYPLYITQNNEKINIITSLFKKIKYHINKIYKFII